MILVDSSVWIKHFRNAEPRLDALLVHELVSLHPFVLGELASGNLHKRAETIADLEDLPVAAVASEPEVLHLLESRRLWGTGLGWVDLHLLASALIEESKLWTADRAVAAAADRLGWEPHFRRGLGRAGHRARSGTLLVGCRLWPLPGPEVAQPSAVMAGGR